MRSGPPPAVFVTGTSTGIGRACVDELAGRGWRVFAGVRTSEDADRLLADIGDQVRPLQVDVTDADQIHAAVEAVATELAGSELHGLVNNAGIFLGGAIETTTPEQWRRQFEVNVVGLASVTRAMLPLVRTARGRIVNVSSVVGRMSMPMMGPYAASKHAVEAICEALRFEVAPMGIHACCVNPGAVSTPFWTKLADQIDTETAPLPLPVQRHYRRHTDAVRGLAEQGGAGGVDPGKVARTIHRALTSRRPKDHYLVGAGAKVAAGVISRLPDRLRRTAMRQNLTRLQRTGATGHQRDQGERKTGAM